MTARLRDDKFIISCAARTGSTMLQQMLDSHPDVLCHGEVMDRAEVGLLVGRYLRMRWKAPEVDERLWTYRVERPEAFLYDVIFDAQGRRAVGFKFKTDEAFGGDPSQRAFNDLIVRDLDIKVIRLRRRDLVAQRISHRVATTTGVTYLRHSSDAPVVEPIRIDPARAVAYIRDVRAREARADEAYAEHRQLRADYEDLVVTDSPAAAAVLDFLGVDARPLTVSTRKILDTDSRGLVSNLDDVLAALGAEGLLEDAS